MQREQYIKELIKGKGLTIKEFANQIDMPYSTLLSMLNGSLGGASVDNVIRICKSLGITVEDLDNDSSEEDMTNTIGDRIKLVRSKEYLDLTQAEFADKIGLKQAAIGLYENGERNVTDRNVSLICEKFSICESWLRTGKGKMFIEVATNEIDQLAERYNLNPIAKNIVKMFISLSEDEMNAVTRKIKEFVLDAEQEDQTKGLSPDGISQSISMIGQTANDTVDIKIDLQTQIEAEFGEELSDTSLVNK